MLQKYTEIDFELHNLDVSRLGFIRKNVKKNSPFFFNFDFIISFFFSFCNIVNIDIFQIHRFLLVFWLFTGFLGSVVKLKVNLRLGVYYYHFILNYNITKRRFFFILSFLIEEFLIHQPWSGLKKKENYFLFYFNNLEVFTNYKLARGVYFHRIQKKFFFKLTFNNILFNFFNIYLTSLKFKIN